MFKTNKLRYTSFIALNRAVDKSIFQDSKLLSLMVFISLKVNRNLRDAKDIEDDISKFKITRLEAIRVTDLTEAEFKTRIKRLESMKIIEKVETTNKYTIYSWLENDYIDLNIQKGQPENIQQVASNDYKNINNRDIYNNKTNKSFILNSSNIDSYLTENFYLDPQKGITAQSYKNIINSFMKLKGVRITGDELMTPLKVTEKLFKSGRTESEILGFMNWLSSNRRSEEFTFANAWDMWTVFNKMANYMAGDYRKMGYELEIIT